MALTKYLRDTVDARFTNKAAMITNAEYDETLRSFHDDIDALTAQLALAAGGVLNGVQVVIATDDWNGESRYVHIYTTDSAIDFTLLSAQAIEGMTVSISDYAGNAAANNITIYTEGAETIDGAATLVLSTNYDSVTLQATAGGNWVSIK